MKVTEEDKAWVSKFTDQLKEGALWITELAFFRRKGNGLLCVRSIDEIAPNSGQDTMEISKHIERVKLTCESLGMSFKDTRQTKNN